MLTGEQFIEENRSGFLLQDGERVDYLGGQGKYGIIQSDEVFSFSLDAVLLGNFVTVRTKDRMIDLGTGNGILPLMLMTRSYQPQRVVGVEIQSRLVDMAQRSVYGNKLQDKIQIVELDLKNAPEHFGTGQFDVVISNPPYRPIDIGDQTQNEYKRIAKHEVLCNWEVVVETASRLVKTGGKVAFVHRADRLVDILYQMRFYQIEPKRLRLVHPHLDREPSMVLVEGIRGGGREMRILPPLIVHTTSGEYSDEMKKIYGIE